MFFKGHHFRKILQAREAELVAQLANEVINNEGLPIYGNLFKDGSAGHFSTTKEPKDTHVAIAIGMDEMGFFSDDRDIHTKSPDQNELAEVVEQRNKILERENRQLRETNN